MALSDYNFNSTRNEIIARAFRQLGQIEPGESPSAEQLAQGIEALNNMVQAWEADGIKLWRLTPVEITLADGDNDYSTPSDPPIFDICDAFYRLDSEDLPLRVVNYIEFLRIQDKEEVGEPLWVALQGTDVPTLHVWPTPDSAVAGKKIVLSAIIRGKDFDTAAGTADFPKHWINALTFGLALDLSPEYLTPMAEYNRISDLFDYYYKLAKKGDARKENMRFVSGAF